MARKTSAQGVDGSVRPAHQKVKQTRKVEAHVLNENLIADRRERIIRAAISVFHQQGYQASTTADIAKAAGLTQSNLYNYVRSKQDVLLLVFEHLINMYDDVVSQVCQEYLDPHERIVQSIAALIQVIGQYREEVFILYSEINSLVEPDRSEFARLTSAFIHRFEDLLHDYTLAGESIRITDRWLAANLISFIPAILSLRAWNLDNYPVVNREDAILEFILGGLGIPRLNPM